MASGLQWTIRLALPGRTAPGRRPPLGALPLVTVSHLVSAPAARPGRRDTAQPYGAAASTTQTWPRANVMGPPVVAVNVVPPLASGRDQRMA